MMKNKETLMKNNKKESDEYFKIDLTGRFLSNKLEMETKKENTPSISNLKKPNTKSNILVVISLIIITLFFYKNSISPLKLTNIIESIEVKEQHSEDNSYATIGRWKSNNRSDKGIVTILDYGNVIIMTESFESGIKIEHSIVRKLGRSNQKYQFANQKTKDNYMIDETGKLVIWDNSGLKEILKPI
jgi:hypothetical protein